MQTFYTLWAKYLNTFTRFGLKCIEFGLAANACCDVIGLRIWFYAEFDTLFSLIHALDAQKITFSLYCKKIYKEGDLNNWTDTLSYLSRLHCIFYNSDDSNETLWLKNKNKLLWLFKTICWAIIFWTRIRFPSGSSLAMLLWKGWIVRVSVYFRKSFPNSMVFPLS